MKLTETTGIQPVSTTYATNFRVKLKAYSLLPVASLLLLGVAHATDADGDGITDAVEGAVAGAPISLVRNRGFESPVLTTSFSIMPASVVDNWNTSAACNCIEIWTDGHDGVSPAVGNQFVELNAMAAQDIFQTIQVPAEQMTIEYSFAHRGRNQVDNMDVRLGVDQATAAVVASAATGPVNWARYSGQWVKPAGVTSIYLEFKSVDGGGFGNFIDDVVVNGVSLDTDADGNPDYLDDDSDNDGVRDSIELTVDSDSDGIPDFQDPDSDGAAGLDDDGDGLTNLHEATITNTDPMNADSDGDGLDDGAEVNTHGTDPTNPDTDGGGANDGAEVAIGSDPLNNGADDAQDSDGDGLSDVDEVTAGTDPADPDTDADGLNDGSEVNEFNTDPMLPDTDSDGLSDGFEVLTSLTNPTVVDTDGDQLSDGDEVNNHQTNPLEVDSDSDGLDDAQEINTVGTNPVVADTDADGLLDGEEVNTVGTDPNNPDTDAGGVRDGDEVEAGLNPADSADDVVELDSDDDGIPNSVEGTGDQDNDGIANYLDLDSDNDGITDIIEAGGIDTDGNGMVDDFTDANNDGLDDQVAASPLPVEDSDGDGLANYLDVDSDQDGLSDIFEAGGTDADDNGQVDAFADADGNGLDDAAVAAAPLLDSDSDGVPNYLDLDSDGDGQSDIVESGAIDVNSDGMVDLFIDTDADGVPDQADVNSTGGTDSDDDGIDDLADVDFTAGADINANGIDDEFEADADGDGRATIVANDATTLPDEDGDGTPDVLDVDNTGGSVPSENNGRLITGVSGSGVGCSIVPGKPGALDPLLPLTLLAFIGLIFRRVGRQKV